MGRSTDQREINDAAARCDAPDFRIFERKKESRENSRQAERGQEKGEVKVGLRCYLLWWAFEHRPYLNPVNSRLASGRFEVISIIIPSLNRASLERLLLSIAATVQTSELTYKRDVEVIVSFDSRVLRSLVLPPVFKFAKVTFADVPGVNSARNAGARHSRGEVLWFLDDDTEIFDSSCFRALSDAFIDPKVVAAGGNYRSPSDARFAERGYNALCSVWRHSAGVDDREQLLGGTFAVRKSAWSDVGGFDDRIAYGGTETSFVQRLTRHSKCWKLIADPRLDVIHRTGPRALRDWAKVAYLQGRGKVSTKKSLPAATGRISRSMTYLRKQDVRTLTTLAIFTVPFLVVSQVGSRASR